MIILSWKEYLKDIDKLVKKLKKFNENNILKGVYGVPRGGLIPAVIISHKLKIPLVTHYGKDILVCDEISDTGKTFANIITQSYFSIGLTCSLYVRNTSKFYPDVYVKQIDGVEWVVFPYEEIPEDESKEKQPYHSEIDKDRAYNPNVR